MSRVRSLKKVLKLNSIKSDSVTVKVHIFARGKFRVFDNFSNSRCGHFHAADTLGLYIILLIRCLFHMVASGVDIFVVIQSTRK